MNSLNYARQVLDTTGTFGSGADQVDRVDAEVPQNRCYRQTEASPCDTGGEGGRDQILVRMTHRHFAIFRTRMKPYCAYNSSGPVCRYAPRCGGRSSVCSG
jgi:hypothetical protein